MLTSASNLTIGHQQQLVKPMSPNIPSLHIAIPSPPHRPLQVTARRSNHSLDTVSSDRQGESMWVGKSENARPYDTPRTTIQNSSVTKHSRSAERQGGQSTGRVRRTPSHRNTAVPEPHSPLPIDPKPFDPNNPYDGQVSNQVYNHAGGAGRSRTNFQNNPGGRNPSRRDASGKGSREWSVRELVFVVLTLAQNWISLAAWKTPMMESIGP